MTTEIIMQNSHPVQFKSDPVFPQQCKRYTKGNYKHDVYKIWHRCYLDKGDFSQKKLVLSQNDIFELCASKNISPAAGMYIVPKQPKQLLSRQNALIVDKNQRKFLLALWRMTKDENKYIASVEQI
jgi:hypothetical protein